VFFFSLVAARFFWRLDNYSQTHKNKTNHHHGQAKATQEEERRPASH
jgi:hypothetical protein